MSRTRASTRCFLACALTSLSCCGGTLDAGSDKPHGLLPIDERNPIIIDNDSATDNWQPLFTVLFANAGRPNLAGIIVNSSAYWPKLDTNMADWNGLVAAARASGLRGIPDPTATVGAPLSMPADGNIDTTTPNGSMGAQLIIDASRSLSLPYRPLVVVTGGQLTDVADAYLVDHTVADRVVVVSMLGTASSAGGTMGAPNGQLDPWADWIVTQRFQYVQVSTPYDQAQDIPASMLAQLPQNPLGTWIASTQPNVAKLAEGAGPGDTGPDQIAIIAVALPTFVTEVQRASPDVSAAFDPTAGPALIPDPNGRTWLVTSMRASAGSELWQMLLDPKTYGG